MYKQFKTKPALITTTQKPFLRIWLEKRLLFFVLASKNAFLPGSIYYHYFLMINQSLTRDFLLHCYIHPSSPLFQFPTPALHTLLETLWYLLEPPKTVSDQQSVHRYQSIAIIMITINSRISSVPPPAPPNFLLLPIIVVGYIYSYVQPLWWWRQKQPVALVQGNKSYNAFPFDQKKLFPLVIQTPVLEQQFSWVGLK